MSSPATGASLREIANSEVADPDHPERGVARRLDLQREPAGWNDRNPRAAERAATALFVYSISPRPGGRRGATQSELLASTFVPAKSYGTGDAEVVWAELCDPNNGLTAIDKLPGKGGQPLRWVFETRQTLRMLERREREAITDAERDAVVTSMAFDIASSGPFDRTVDVDGGDVPANGVTVDALRALLEGAGIDDRRSNRLVVLDSRWFSLNGGDSDARAALRAAFGLGDDRLAVSWASSTVFACINTQRRSHARGIASDFLAAQRVSRLDAVRNNEEHADSAADTLRDAHARLRKAVSDAYQHVVHLADDGSGGRAERYLRFGEDNQSALNGSVVWAALDAADKSFGQGAFDAAALLHNLREQDWGLPLSELRDMFWNTPRVPLLPGGESDLRRALHGAITSGDVEIVDSAGEIRAVPTAADINLGSGELRVQRPSKGQVEVPNLIGRTAADARSALEQAGLMTKTALAGSTGVVAAQAPTPGTRVESGATITMTLQPTGEKPQSAPTEHQVTLTITKSLSDDEVRNAIWRLFNTIAEAIDTDASHIQMTIQVTAPSAATDKIAEAAERADLPVTVRDL